MNEYVAKFMHIFPKTSVEISCWDIQVMGRLLFFLRLISHGPLGSDTEWSKLVSAKWPLPPLMATTVLVTAELSVLISPKSISSERVHLKQWSAKQQASSCVAAMW